MKQGKGQFFYNRKQWKIHVTKGGHGCVRKNIWDLEMNKTITECPIGTFQDVYDFLGMFICDWFAVDQAILQLCRGGSLLVKKQNKTKFDSSANYSWQ